MDPDQCERLSILAERVQHPRMNAAPREVMEAAIRFLDAVRESPWAVFDPEVEQHLVLVEAGLDALDRTLAAHGR